MNCPACGYYNPPAQQSCLHCSLPLPIPAGDALCAVHLEVKAVGACSRCGTFGCGACLSARGTAWLCAACLNRVGRLPWDERASLGIWRAWWRTAVLMISSPVEALRTAEPDAPLGSSVLFVLIASVVGFGSTMACYALLLVPMMMFGSPGKSAFGSGLLAGSMIFIVAFYAVLLLATQLAGALFLSALEQVGLMLLGAQPKRFTVTVRAHALSMGVYLTGLMPFCSLPVFGLWALGLRIIALQHLHQTTGGKAAGAVLLPLGMLVGGLAAFSFAVIALAMNFSR